MNTFKTTTLALCLTTALFSCNNASKENKEAAAPQKDILVEIMDTTVKPQEDFFKYAIGGWLKQNPIPASESYWGIASKVEEENYSRVKTICEEAAKSNAEKGSNTQKIGDYYFSGMDSASIEKAGVSALSKEMERINNIKNTKDLLQVVSLFQSYYLTPMFYLAVGQDLKHSEQMALYLYQGGIGLPERDYYFNTDARTKNIREEYVKYIANMLSYTGDKDATKKAEAIFKLETALAKASRKLVDLRDDYKNYNKMSVAQVNKITPSINWTEFLGSLNIKIDSVIVGQPEFLVQLEKSIKTESIDTWKDYLRFRIVDAFSAELSSNFNNEMFRFRGTVMNGIKEQRPRYKRVLDDVEDAVGFILGQLYVEKYFPPATKKRYEIVVDNMMQAYKERIQNLDWMTPETKTKAIVKLDAVRKKVGYPDKWRDYSALNINRTSYVENAINSNQWKFNYGVSKLGKPVDRNEWEMTPQTYNAYYNPSNNEIVLPAAMFTIPGLPDSLADDAIIYSYAGASTIGHEVTHGFDDQGRKYDELGNLKNWWTKSDEDQYNNRAQKIINQFTEFKVLDSLHINGEATQGENIADLGGVVIGWEAFKKTEQYKNGKTISGLTPSQRFFLGYALSWMSHQRDEALAMRIMTDVHSPARFRVNGPLSNIPDFYKAFNIKAGDPMYRDEKVRVKIW